MENSVAILTIEKIKGEPIHFVNLELEQSIADHARVKITLDLEHFDENVLTNPMERITLINEKFQIDVNIKKDDSSTKVYGFLGIITDIKVDVKAGLHGFMHIYGSSQSIELERGENLKTFSEKKLSEILNIVTENKILLKLAEPKTNYEDPLKFSMQYYETDFQYLKRLAWMYGEKLLFTGDSLVFGNISNEKTVKIEYNSDLIDLQLNSKLISNRFSPYYHTLKEEKEPESPTSPSSSSSGTFTGEAGNKSDLLNPKKQFPDIPLSIPVYDNGNREKIAEIRRKTTMNRMFLVTGKTKVYKVSIGDLLQIEFDEKMKVNDSLGTLRITKVRHYFDQNGRYENNFEACQQSVFDLFPYENIEFPHAQPIEATVKQNVDPEGLGRVKVKFDFEDNECDFWLRCLTPDAGGDKSIGIERNKGINFVPDLKDRLMIGFVGGNPEKPFVMGSMFHGTNASKLGGGAGNPLHFIRDKSGTEIVFNDKEGSLKIHSPKGKSTITIDGKGNISIDAPKTITMNATDINLNASNVIKLNASSAVKIGFGDNPDNIVVDTESDTVAIESSKNTIKGEGSWNGGNVFIN